MRLEAATKPAFICVIVRSCANWKPRTGKGRFLCQPVIARLICVQVHGTFHTHKCQRASVICGGHTAHAGRGMMGYTREHRCGPSRRLSPPAAVFPPLRAGSSVLAYPPPAARAPLPRRPRRVPPLPPRSKRDTPAGLAAAKPPAPPRAWPRRPKAGKGADR